MKIELTLKTSHSQFLGIVNDKSIIIEPDKKMIISGDEWEKIKNRNWVKHLIGNGLLEAKEIDKKMKKMEKDIETGALEVNG